MKNGNYSFEGVFKDLLDDLQGDFNMRLIHERSDFLVLKLTINVELSIKYIILDPSEVSKYGLWGAIFKPLDQKVRKT